MMNNNLYQTNSFQNNDHIGDQENLRSYNIKRSGSEDEIPSLANEGEEKMKILQNFLQNPYDPNTKNQINFSPQRVLQEKYPELSTLDFKNQYNFYKNLSTAANVDSYPKRWEYLYEMNKIQKGAKELMLRNQEEEKKIDVECTFKPFIMTKESKFSKKVDKEKDRDFLNRAFEWNQQKNEKIKNIKAKEVDKDLDECTFHPQIHNTLVPRTNSSINTTSEQLIVNKKGVDKFLKRQIQARQAKEEKVILMAQGSTQHIMNVQGKKDRITIPKEFHFSKNSGQNLSAQSGKRGIIEKEIDESFCHLSDFTYGEAINYLHEQLVRIEI